MQKRVATKHGAKALKLKAFGRERIASQAALIALFARAVDQSL